MSLNRTIAPETHPITDLKFPKIQSFVSKSSVPVYTSHDQHCNILKVEFVFDAGKSAEKTPFQAQATGSLITEGTLTRNAEEIASALDFHGSYIQQRTGADDASIVLYTLPKHLPSCLAVFSDLHANAQFPENELVIHKQHAIQRLLVNEKKNTFLARRAFYQSVLGKESSYGKPVYQEDISNISRETLVSFYNTCYKSRLKYVLLSGNITPETLNGIMDIAGRSVAAIPTKPSFSLPPFIQEQIHIEQPQSVQSAIRIGRVIPTRNDANFRKLQVLNLVLGGFFGSRLMSNIREEKGLTYGIYSVMESYKEAGAFYIETEMNNDLVNEGVREIFKELKTLREEPIGSEELKTAKNYLLGNFLRSLDGPLSLSDRMKVLLDFNLTEAYYNEYIEIIHAITPLELQELANIYFLEQDLTTVVVGKK